MPEVCPPREQREEGSLFGECGRVGLALASRERRRRETVAARRLNMLGACMATATVKGSFLAAAQRRAA